MVFSSNLTLLIEDIHSAKIFPFEQWAQIIASDKNDIVNQYISEEGLLTVGMWWMTMLNNKSAGETFTNIILPRIHFQKFTMRNQNIFHIAALQKYPKNLNLEDDSGSGDNYALNIVYQYLFYTQQQSIIGDLWSQIDHEGYTPFLAAVRSGYTPNVRFFFFNHKQGDLSESIPIAYFFSPSKPKTLPSLPNGDTVLHLAARSGNYLICSYIKTYIMLFEKGRYFIDVIKAVNNDGATFLHVAAICRFNRIFQLFFDMLKEFPEDMSYDLILDVKWTKMDKYGFTAQNYLNTFIVKFDEMKKLGKQPKLDISSVPQTFKNQSQFEKWIRILTGEDFIVNDYPYRCGIVDDFLFHVWIYTNAAEDSKDAAYEICAEKIITKYGSVAPSYWIESNVKIECGGKAKSFLQKFVYQSIPASYLFQGYLNNTFCGEAGLLVDNVEGLKSLTTSRSLETLLVNTKDNLFWQLFGDEGDRLSGGNPYLPAWKWTRNHEIYNLIWSNAEFGEGESGFYESYKEFYDLYKYPTVLLKTASELPTFDLHNRFFPVPPDIVYHSFLTNYSSCRFPSRDQGDVCDTCFIFAPLGALSKRTCAMLRDNDKYYHSTNLVRDAEINSESTNPLPSVQQVIDCTAETATCKGGGYPLVSMNWIANNAVTVEACEPFQLGKIELGQCRDHFTCQYLNIFTRMKGYSLSNARPLFEEREIDSELFNSGPIVCSIALYKSLHDYADSASSKTPKELEVYKFDDAEIANAKVTMYHAMQVCGWGKDKNAKKFYIVENSWGDIYPPFTRFYDGNLDVDNFHNQQIHNGKQLGPYLCISAETLLHPTSTFFAFTPKIVPNTFLSQPNYDAPTIVFENRQFPSSKMVVSTNITHVILENRDEFIGFSVFLKENLNFPLIFQLPSKHRVYISIPSSIIIKSGNRAIAILKENNWLNPAPSTTPFITIYPEEYKKRDQADFIEIPGGTDIVLRTAKDSDLPLKVIITERIIKVLEETSFSSHRSGVVEFMAEAIVLQSPFYEKQWDPIDISISNKYPYRLLLSQLSRNIQQINILRANEMLVTVKISH